MLSGNDHELLLYVRTLPSKSTAAQKLAVGQETESRPPPLGSMFSGNDHNVPS